jgi:arabinogalactan oligomer/maltooligosaccharide transport system permease protein
MWVGIPFTILITSGILMNIPSDLYEAARIDGAGVTRQFRSITMPYMLVVTTPYLITQFIQNLNNFNVIYFLTLGEPKANEYFNAGHTDLLITWLYKLTIVNKDYNLGSVIGIAVFVLMATFSLLAYRRSGAYRNEEEFQK